MISENGWVGLSHILTLEERVAELVRKMAIIYVEAG